MTSISSIETVTVRSLSPSVLSSSNEHEWTWLTHEAGTSATKGKKKEVDIPLDEFESDERPEGTDSSIYPPLNDNETETRRVQEVRRHTCYEVRAQMLASLRT